MSKESDVVVEHFFLNLIKHCWNKKWHFIIPMAIAAIVLVGFCMLSVRLEPGKSPLPNKYTSTAKLLVRETSSKSAISSSLASLASLGGIDIGGGADSNNRVLITTISETNSFKDAIIEEFDLVSRYKIEKHIKSNARKKLNKVLSVVVDEDTNIMSVSFTDIDPVFAKKVSSFAVELLLEKFYDVSEDDNTINLKNYQEAMDSSFMKILQYQKDIQDLEQSVSNSASASIPSIMFDVQMKKLELEAEESIYASFRGQFELLSIQNQDAPTTIKLLQEPEIPDMKSGPSRGMLCIVGELIVFIVCFAIVFMRYYVSLSVEKPDNSASKEVVK